MTDKISINEYADVLKLLADKTRLIILKILSETDCCVCVFVEVLDISQPAVSQHLRKLKDLKLIEEERNKQWVLYSFAQDSKYSDFVQNILNLIPNNLIDTADVADRMEKIKAND